MTGTDPLLLQELQRRGLAPPAVQPQMTPMAAPGPQGNLPDAALMDELRRRNLVKAPAPTIADDLAALPGKAYGAVKDMVTGDGRKEDGIGELPDSFVPGFGSTAHRMAFARDDAGKLDIYKKAHPDAKSRQDASGNVIVTAPDGKEYYLNRPGLSGQDAYDFGTETAFMLPAAKAAGAIGSAAGTVGKIAATGGATGGASVAQDLTAQAGGSKQPVDTNHALLSGAVGAGAEALAPILSPLARRGAPDIVDPKTGDLSAAGLDALKRAGIDPESVTQSFRERFAKEAQGAVDPARAAVATEASTLPVPVPQTRGIQTLAPADQMFEDLAAKGTYGDLASSVVRNRRSEIDDALQGNVGAIQGRMAGGESTMTRTGEAGPRVQVALDNQAGVEKKAVNKAYGEARDARGGLPGGFVDGMKMDLHDAVVRDHDVKALPRTSSLLDDLNGFSSDANTSTSIRPLFEWRKRLVAAQKAGGEESVALGKVKAAFDQKMEDALSQALIQGDERAIDAFRQANQMNREFASRFKGGDVIEALVTREPRSGQMQLATSPDVASNVLFGSSRLFGGANTARDISRLRDVIGADSPQWNNIREEAWLRLARAGEGPKRADGSAAFSGAKFARAVDNALTDHPQLMQTLFSPEELATIQQFKRVAARATTPVEGGKNFSNTTPGMANVVQNLANATFMGEGAATRLMAIPLVRALYQGGMGIRALGATRPTVPGLATQPGAIGGVGATLAPDEGGK